MVGTHEIVTKRPSECTANEFKKIVALVREGGEVTAGGLEDRARQAEVFALLTSNEEIVGIADTRNLASIRILERVGMIKVDTRSAKSRGKRCTEFVYNAHRHNVG